MISGTVPPKFVQPSQSDDKNNDSDNRGDITADTVNLVNRPVEVSPGLITPIPTIVISTPSSTVTPARLPLLNKTALFLGDRTSIFNRNEVMTQLLNFAKANDKHRVRRNQSIKFKLCKNLIQIERKNQAHERKCALFTKYKGCCERFSSAQAFRTSKDQDSR